MEYWEKLKQQHVQGTRSTETKRSFRKRIGLIWLELSLCRGRRIQEVTGKALSISRKGRSQTCLPGKPKPIFRGKWEHVQQRFSLKGVGSDWSFRHINLLAVCPWVSHVTTVNLSSLSVKCD